MRLWQIDIPRPSADRLKPRELVVELESGWGGGRYERHDLTADAAYFLWVGPDELPKFDTGVLDGIYYTFRVRYCNSTGSRIEDVGVWPSELVSAPREEARAAIEMVAIGEPVKISFRPPEATDG